MSLVPSLLQAVIGLDGEALVIHVGEKPYVVAPSGQVELATRALTFEAVTGILEQMLPAESRVIVQGVHVAKRHTRPRMGEPGGIVEKELTIHISNVAHIDPQTRKPTRSH